VSGVSDPKYLGTANRQTGSKTACKKQHARQAKMSLSLTVPASFQSLLLGCFNYRWQPVAQRLPADSVLGIGLVGIEWQPLTRRMVLSS
jgi:hypothetical protein